MAAHEAELERELDRLYALPLDEFTAARTEAARRLRKQGQRALATTVTEQRKPTLPAWVVNQLARKRELDVQRLVKAGEQLGAAQAEAVRGGGADAFLEARKEEQLALQRLAAAAREVLADAGRPVDPNLDRVLATLRAAALTGEGRSLLKCGRLTQEIDPPGFEALAGVGPVERPLPTRRQGEPIRRDRPPDASEADAVAARREEERRRRERATEAREQVRTLRHELHAHDSKLRKALMRAARLRKDLEAAEADANALEAERSRVEDAIAAAERELEQLTRQA